MWRNRNIFIQERTISDLVPRSDVICTIFFPCLYLFIGYLRFHLSTNFRLCRSAAALNQSLNRSQSYSIWLISHFTFVSVYLFHSYNFWYSICLSMWFQQCVRVIQLFTGTNTTNRCHSHRTLLIANFVVLLISFYRTFLI